uniref:Uncharacterized protein n=1 Tax=Arundo donax TaxID=35708 RepID=A0A0A9BZ91_ARUDO
MGTHSSLRTSLRTNLPVVAAMPGSANPRRFPDHKVVPRGVRPVV